jgi:hypothetical protein
MAQTPAFGMSRMSTASRILLGAGSLLLIDSFFTWERVCPELAGLELECVDSANMWGGSGQFFGILAGLVLVLMLAWEGLQVAGVGVNIAMDASKLSAFLGFGVLILAFVKFIFVLPDTTLWSWLGLLLTLAIGYGAWMRFQEPAAAAPPPPPPAINDGAST